MERFGYVNDITLMPTYGWITISLTIIFNLMYLNTILWPNYWNMKYVLLNIGWNIYIAAGLLFNIGKAFLQLYKLEANFETLLIISGIGMFLTFNYYNLLQKALCWYKFYTIELRLQKLRSKLMLLKFVYDH